MASKYFDGEFWIIAVSKESNSREKILSEQRAKLSKYCSITPFDMPNLRVSALDELLNLNEKLMKYDNFARTLLSRLVRSYREYMEQPKACPQVKDRNLYKYIPDFEWEKARFSLHSKLPSMTEDIYERIVTTNDRLKSLIDKYKKLRQKIQADERANEGNLMVRDLQGFVTEADFIEGEYMTTALVVVPANKCQDFEDHYFKLETTEEAEKLWKREQKAKAAALGADDAHIESAEMEAEDREKLVLVVPDSLKVLEKQSDFSLYRVVILKKGVKWFTDICREFRYNVREFEYKSRQVMACDVEEMKKLQKEESDKKKRLVMFCNHAFPEAVELWLHIKMIRVFIEAVLRFGLGGKETSAQFSTSILMVNNGAQKSLTVALSNMYKHLETKEMMGGEEGVNMMGMGELRPYVFVPLMANFD